VRDGLHVCRVAGLEQACVVGEHGRLGQGLGARVLGRGRVA